MGKVDSPFDILGIKADATDADVKTAYRSLVKLHHPDKGGDDTEFLKIQAAYNKAKSPKWRKQYQAIAQASQTKAQDIDDLISSTQYNNPTISVSGRNIGKTYAQQIQAQYVTSNTPYPSWHSQSSSQNGNLGNYSYPSGKIQLPQSKKFIIPPHSARNIQAMQNRVGLGGSYNTYQMTFEYIVDQNREVPLAGDEVVNIADILYRYMPMYANNAQQRFTSSPALVTESRTSIRNGICTCSLTVEWS